MNGGLRADRSVRIAGNIDGARPEAMELLDAATAFRRASERLYQLRGIGERSRAPVDRVLHPILSVLAVESPLRVTDIANRIARLRSTVSRQVDQLERLGIVEHDVDPADGRAYRVRLTEHGLQIREALARAWATELDRALAGWPAIRLHRIAAELDAVAIALGQPNGEV